MSRLAICPQCGGKGTIWTGAERIRCPRANCDDGRIVVRRDLFYSNDCYPMGRVK